jgi:aquaporin Z
VFSIGSLLAYWAFQFGGAFAAAGVAYALWGPKIALGASHPGPGYGAGIAVVAEVLATLLLVLVILMTAVQKFSVGKQAAIAVGLTVATCGFFLGPVSGASMNPARSIAPQILGGRPELAWIYAVGPCAGAALAVLVVWVLTGPPKEEEAEAAHGG